MQYVIDFDAPDATVHALVGGKGANLGRMTGAAFPVPPGFTVSTEVHSAFLQGDVLDRVLAEVDGLDYDDMAAVGAATDRARVIIAQTPVPDDVATAIRDAYDALGDDPYVAVRSSGTAEDLTGASFAGLHDTYLDVRGADDVVAAVQACWASLFTDRATTYRAGRGFDHREARMGVVVQLMVSSEASGVMFTGNPLTEANDEIVINSSWGLGEAVVQGIVNPDQITLHTDSLRVLEHHIGHKAIQLIRNAEGKGATEVEVPAERRDQRSITDEVIRELGELGRRVQDYYGGLPQDIEWAVAGGRVYLLQSRPITGVNFAWDCEVDYFQKEEPVPDTVWSRVLADDVWTGAITPLFFSSRGEAWSIDYRDASLPMLADDKLAALRMVKYYRGEAYVNAEAEKCFIRWAPPMARPGMAVRLPAEMQADALAQPFSYLDYVKVLSRARLVYKVGTPYGWMRYLDDCFANRVDEARGLPAEELPALSDAALKRYIHRQVDFEHEYNRALIWPGMFYYVRDMMTALMAMLSKWYTGEPDPLTAFTHLVTGTEKITRTVREHLELNGIARTIRASEQLSKDFANNRDDAFFATLANSDEGRAFQGTIDSFLAEGGHRGHAERDIYFPRYQDDAGVLYRAIEAHTKSDEDPVAMHEANNARRDRLRADIEQNLRGQFLGSLKVEAFRYVLTYVLRFLEYRDDERHFIDLNTYSLRQAYQEVDRRIRERGRLDGERDFWFLSQPELFAVLDGTHSPALTAAKIAGRMQNFDRFNTKQWKPPKFLRDNRPLVEASESAGADGVLRGLPTSSGTITGTARVVPELSQISRVQRGEILVANSTDPGWTPVFALLAGAVTETGGLLSHTSCLAREYGFPAVQVENAMQLIPDGATITIHGDTGSVTIEAVPDAVLAEVGT